MAYDRASSIVMLFYWLAFVMLCGVLFTTILPNFWDILLKEIGQIDGFLDDGGHQSFQQIATLEALLKHLKLLINQNLQNQYLLFLQAFMLAIL